MADPNNPSDPLLDFGVDLTSVKTRLIAMGYFVGVEGIREATEALSQGDGFAFTPPAAFVSIASETAQRDRVMRTGAGGHSQRVDIRLSILFAESAVVFNRGGDDQVDRVRRAIIRQLIFWTPDGAAIALQYDRYLLRATGNGLVWGEVLFTTAYNLSSL